METKNEGFSSDFQVPWHPFSGQKLASRFFSWHPLPLRSCHSFAHVQSQVSACDTCPGKMEERPRWPGDLRDTQRWSFRIPVVASGYLVGGWTNPFETYTSQNGKLPQVRMNIKRKGNHHLDWHRPPGRIWHVFTWFFFSFVASQIRTN